MTSYYYPFGYTPNITQVGYTSLAGRATTPSSTAIGVLTASFASIVINTPLAGTNGTSPTSASCGTGPTGAKGSTGPSGSVAGTSITSCPAGTTECASLTPPAGYSKVCIQIPVGCLTTVICPDSLTGYAPVVCYNQSLGYDAASSETACSTGTLSYTSDTSTITIGTVLYGDGACATIASIGYYSNGSRWYSFDGGAVTSDGLCIF